MSTQADDVKRFKEGSISLFFIINENKDIESVEFVDITIRKIDDERISLPCWGSEEQAKEFLKNVLRGNLNLKVMAMNKNQLADVLENTYPFDRKNILLELF
jgi:hypothetical protein